MPTFTSFKDYKSLGAEKGAAEIGDLIVILSRSFIRGDPLVCRAWMASSAVVVAAWYTSWRKAWIMF